jgi:hypothetical protein
MMEINIHININNNIVIIFLQVEVAERYCCVLQYYKILYNYYKKN